MKFIILFLLITLNAYSYDRKEYGRWKIDKETGCRLNHKIIMERYVYDYGYTKLSKCKVEAVWIDFYTGKLILNQKDINIDHILPVYYYDKHCRKGKSKKQIRAFYNDIDNLVITTRNENMRKGSKTPKQYSKKIKNDKIREIYESRFNASYEKHCR